MKKLLALLCCLLCLTSLFSFTATAEEASPDVRVYLRRLALTDRADLWLACDYAVSSSSGLNMILPMGTHVTLQLRDNEYYLFYLGMSLKAGKELKWTRLATEGAATYGFRFSETGNLYPGDLTLKVSSGQIYPVLTLSLEDYLPGVVPYEMSDSFPIEALKAQAICARTYAFSHLDPAREYDVVDTTNDQVFKGLDPSMVNSARAVRDTAGLICTWKDKPAICYFAASNGGQTELISHAWPGTEDLGCYVIKDDPYDQENPQSLTRTLNISKSGDNLYASLRTALMEHCLSRMVALGYTNGPDSVRIDRILDVSLQKPRYASPSRLMTGLSITYSASGRILVPVETPMPAIADDEDFYLFATPDPGSVTNALPTPTPRLSSWIPAEETFTVNLSVFPDLIRSLNLSISGSDNEILSVKDTGNAFVITSGRYGHGVGMSQRGAEQMAGHHGKNFSEILAFYYPGTVLKKIASGAPVPVTPDPMLAVTPGPPATPTPRPTLMPVTVTDLPAGAWLASVEGIEDDSTLNLRQEPSPIATILMRLYKHQQLLVLGTCEDPSWVHVRTDSVEGYVMVSFLEKIK